MKGRAWAWCLAVGPAARLLGVCAALAGCRARFVYETPGPGFEDLSVLSEDFGAGDDMPGVDLASFDLASDDMPVIDLGGIDLFGADVTGRDWSTIDLTRIDVGDGDLGASDLAASDLAGSDLAASDLTMPDLTRPPDLALPLGPFAEGQFMGRAGHGGQGTARLVRVAGGAVELHFLPDFKVTGVAGPVVVLSSRSAIGAGPLDPAMGDLELGPLKATMGGQTYPVPGGDGGRRYAWVWCKPFRVEIARAPMMNL